MNLFEIFTAMLLGNLYGDYTWLVALSLISFLLNTLFFMFMWYRYRNLPKSTTDNTSNQQDGPQKERRRVKKIFALTLAIICTCQMITAFVEVGKGTKQKCIKGTKHNEIVCTDIINGTCEGSAFYNRLAETHKNLECGFEPSSSGPIWCVIINAFWNALIALYLLATVLTTLPVTNRMKLIKNTSATVFVLAHVIILFAYQAQVNTTYTMGVERVTMFGGVTGVLIAVTLVLNSAYTIVQGCR